MTVKYAVQILSKTMLVALSAFETPESTATVEFCEMIDSFFDCLNLRSLTEGRRKIKPFLEPYINQNDAKFTWLIKNSLEYFSKWKESIETRPVNFTATAKSKMFVSYQTHQGFKITCYSIVDCVKCLLQEEWNMCLLNDFHKMRSRNTLETREKPDADQKTQMPRNSIIMITIRIQRNVSHTSGNAKRTIRQEKTVG